MNKIEIYFDFLSDLIIGFGKFEKTLSLELPILNSP